MSGEPSVWRTFEASGNCTNCGVLVTVAAGDSAFRIALDRRLVVTCPECGKMSVPVERMVEA